MNLSSRLDNLAIPPRYLPAMIFLLGEVLERRPEETVTAIRARIDELDRLRFADPAFRPDDDPSTVILRAVADVDPASTELVLDLMNGDLPT